MDYLSNIYQYRCIFRESSCFNLPLWESSYWEYYHQYTHRMDTWMDTLYIGFSRWNILHFTLFRIPVLIYHIPPNKIHPFSFEYIRKLTDTHYSRCTQNTFDSLYTLNIHSYFYREKLHTNSKITYPLEHFVRALSLYQTKGVSSWFLFQILK